MPRPVARAAAFQAAVFGMTGLLDTRLKIADRFDATVPSYRTLGLPALKGLPSRHPRISPFSTAQDDRHRIPHITARLRRRKYPLCQSVNYRQHQKHQADRRFAALAPGVLGICAIRGFARPVGWGTRRRLSFGGMADPGVPIRRSVATINSGLSR